MQLTGAEIVIECLLEQGVDTVFGYPGGSILNVYDALYAHSDEITHILTSHEQGASHAADGYARSTGKVGVCFATSGPGATNLVTGIATAYMDSVPLVAITCNVGVSLLGKDSFQEVDIAGITTPITKHNFIVKEVSKLADTIRRAFDIARRGRPGPVLVDITKDVTASKVNYSKKQISELKQVVSDFDNADIEKVKHYIERSKKPVIFVGGGATISGAGNQIMEFADKIDAPVCDSLMGKGAMPGENDKYMGMLGMHGTKVSNLAVSECDLLIALGTRFSDRVLGNPKKFAKGAKIVHVDIDPAEINKNVIVDAEIIGDICEVLDKLIPRLNEYKHKDWMEKIRSLKEKFPTAVPSEGLTGPYVIDEIYKKTSGDAIITTEVGQHQMWAAQYYRFKRPRQFITSGGLGTMGYGLGASIGAAIGNPGKRVINIAGDGCLRMNMNEIATAVRNKLPIIEIVINNHVLGMVRQWQDLFYHQHYSQTILGDEIDYVKLAEAMGATGLRATSREEFDNAIDKALSMNTPVLIDVVIDKDDKVWPMVAPGAPINECFDENDL
ncbi:MAG: biosynthetic-type acetolactate synthase large subunit [Lachnospiraceae bacterium]|nr:biosynthetic-type acetolactate synthase large subunit [Lachnospiraceae bacterium]